MLQKTAHNFLIRCTMMLLLLAPLVLASPSQAFGYADPGSGAFIYQAVYAAFLGGTYYFRRMLNRVWRRRK